MCIYIERDDDSRNGQDHSPPQCYAHILPESSEPRLSLQHTFDELYQKLQLEDPRWGNSHGTALLSLQPMDHLDLALL